MNQNSGRGSYLLALERSPAAPKNSVQYGLGLAVSYHFTASHGVRAPSEYRILSESSYYMSRLPRVTCRHPVTIV